MSFARIKTWIADAMQGKKDGERKKVNVDNKHARCRTPIQLAAFFATLYKTAELNGHLLRD